MNCPVCNRNLAPTLSICPSCGAMMNDSVREELNVKISPAPRTFTMEAKPNPPIAVPKPAVTLPKTPPPAMSVAPELPPIETAPKAPPLPKPPVAIAPAKTNTTEIAAKATSPTLVEFQNKNATLPDWRLQLQNAVRKRVDNVHAPVAFEKTSAVSRVHLPTNGANALKAEIVEQAAPVVSTAASGNPKLANALRRIEESRRRFLAEEQKEEETPKVQPAQNKNYPFYIATKNAEILPKPAEMKAAAAPAPAPAPAPQKPTFEDLPVIEKKTLDTNKLKPLPNAAVIATNLEKVSGDLPKLEEDVIDAPLIKISRVVSDEDEEILEFEETEMVAEDMETEDLAPFAMRFNAGVFDLIIGSFASFVMFSAALMISGGNWYSLPGLLAFLVTFAVVMFVYLTTAIGMFGKTVGMKIFSLETIDIEENDYPTFHQAAVSSSVYLVSLALGGIGFLPALFNSERRTAPDLLSGTIIVKE